jgi:hypothetical protein
MLSQNKACLTKYFITRSIQAIFIVFGFVICILCGYCFVTYIILPIDTWTPKTWVGPTGYVYDSAVHGWIPPETPSIMTILWVGFWGDFAIVIMGAFIYAIVLVLFGIGVIISDDYNNWAKVQCSKTKSTQPLNT